MDLIRRIAFVIEESDGIDSTAITIDGFNADQIAYHCELMNEAGLFTAIDTTCMSSPYSEFHINRLTTVGHDFVDAARNDTLWKKAMATVKSQVGGVTIELMIQYLKAQAMSRLGLSAE